MPKNTFIALICLLCPSALWAGDEIVPGKFIVEPPTMECLGFRWETSGDANDNAVASIRYRAGGQSDSVCIKTMTIPVDISIAEGPQKQGFFPRGGRIATRHDAAFTA